MTDTHEHASKGMSALDWLVILAAAIGLGLLIHGNMTGPGHGGGHGDQEAHVAAGAGHAHGHEAGHDHQAAAHGHDHGDAADHDHADHDHEHMADAHAAEGHGGHGDHDHPPALFSVIPFVLLLLCIAVLPLISATEHWWEHNENRLLIAAILGAITLAYYFLAYDGAKVVYILEHAVLEEYIPFMVLLFSLYVISGGINLRGDLVAKPSTNTVFLAIGAAIASFIGTTGASMLLIRPLLQTNSERKHVRHTVIFFIFLVSNIGGCLLPIGDPPLFLGYLMGVPFLWTFQLWLPWLAVCACLLVIYYVWDTIAYKKETSRDLARDEKERTPLRLSGTLNFLWLVGIVLCVGMVKDGEPFPLLSHVGIEFTTFKFLREILMLLLTGVSLVLTKKSIRVANQFNYHAIIEVGALFIGIFICMQAPIGILNASGKALEEIFTSPAAFFWATGSLSSFLDNAPTYVVFFKLANSIADPSAAGMMSLAGGNYIAVAMLRAISLGAVFMGAMTYIGNGPNFMVKSIAEQSGVRMPSFFGYMIFSVCILIPLFLLVTVVFL